MCVVPRSWNFDDVFDALEQGCGDFLLELRLHLAQYPAETVILVASRDAGSPVEVPAWCRLTGHNLLEERHPYYLIRKKENQREE